MKLDSIDLKILKELQEHGRMSASNIAEKIEVSVPTITERLNQFRRPEDQLPTYDKNQGTFVKGNKKGPLTDFKEETTTINQPVQFSLNTATSEVKMNTEPFSFQRPGSFQPPTTTNNSKRISTLTINPIGI